MSPRKVLRVRDTTPRLDVYLGSDLVGHLGEAADRTLWFRYADAVLEGPTPERHALSVRLAPVQGQPPFIDDDVRAFFDNLLLESDTRAAVARASKLEEHDVVGLLGVVGGECAGAVSLWPHGRTPPAHAQYTPYSVAELAELFDKHHGPQRTRVQIESRQSMSGAQDKLVFRRDATGAFALPRNGAPSNVVLKRPDGRYACLVENEFACQHLAAAIGLPSAGGDIHTLTGGALLFVSPRYDRELHADGTIARLHQEDGCQATGRVRKYQAGGGPGFEDIARILRRYSLAPNEDLGIFLRASLLNIVVGNMDAHGKNFSFLHAPGGVRLAPLYDVVSSLAYPDQLSPDYSMYYGGESHNAKLNPPAMDRFARQLGVTPALVRQAAEEVLSAVQRHLPSVLQAVTAHGGDPGFVPTIEAVIRTQSSLLQRALKRPATPKR